MEEVRVIFHKKSKYSGQMTMQEGVFCISAQIRVYFFGEMVYNRVTGMNVISGRMHAVC